MPLIPALGRQKQVDLCEFEVSLVYRASSRTAEVGGSKTKEKGFLLIFNVCECFACMHVYAPHACNACRGQTKASESLKLEVYTVVSCHVSAGN